MPIADASSSNAGRTSSAGCVAAPQWYVVHTHVHAEAKAAAHLVRQGYSAYLPRYLKKRRHARRSDVVAAPLFPRYLFVSFERGTRLWRSIQSTIGVAHLVCNGDEPAAVPAKVIHDLQSAEDPQGFVRLDARPKFRPGDRIEVVEGVFCSHFGLYEGLSDAERVRILLDLLGRKVRIVLDKDAIVAA